MKEAQYIRKGHVITNAETGAVVFTGKIKTGGNEFVSINAAKRESHRLQMDADRGLGRGSLKVAA